MDARVSKVITEELDIDGLISGLESETGFSREQNQKIYRALGYTVRATGFMSERIFTAVPDIRYDVETRPALTGVVARGSTINSRSVQNVGWALNLAVDLFKVLALFEGCSFSISFGGSGMPSVTIKAPDGLAWTSSAATEALAFCACMCRAARDRREAPSVAGETAS